MKINNLIFKRESLTLPINHREEQWDYLTIYNEEREIIARSLPTHPENVVRLKYDGFDIIALPSARETGEHQILISISSIKNQMK